MVAEVEFALSFHLSITSFRNGTKLVKKEYFTWSNNAEFQQSFLPFFKKRGQVADLLFKVSI